MNPLVSVIVATYNSSPFVVETLDSILQQTWGNIELIITDDFSGDDTVNVCNNWINHNKQRFKSVKVLTFERNTGIPSNVNRGVQASNGNWIKLLAADDTLRPDCIIDNMTWVAVNPKVRILFSYIDVYQNTFESQNFLEKIPVNPYNTNSIMAPQRNADSQYKMLLRSDKIHFTPSIFLHRETLLSVGGFDERFKLQEDYPLWLNLTRNGHKLCFMDKVTVNYRRHIDALNNTGTNELVNPNYFKQEKFRRLCTYPYLPVEIRIYRRYNWYVLQIFRWNWLNKDKKPNRLLRAILTSYMNPVKYYLWMKKRVFKDLRNNEFYKL